MSARRLRVMLLFGGQSAEHDVSRVTAVAVARALDPEKYEVVPVGITRDGQWMLAGEAQRMLASGARDALPDAFVVGGELVPIPTSAAEIDVVIPLMHGPYGEDGTVQGLLELAGIPYVGAGVLSSALNMDKYAMKRILEAASLPVPRYWPLRDGDDVDAFVAQIEHNTPYPCFVKPCNMGSSIGVTKAHDHAELRAGIALALQYDEWMLVEEGIDGREIEVAVLGDGRELTISVPGEVIPGAEFYTYEDKYEDGVAKLLIPAPLAPADTERVRELTAEAFRAGRCEGMARVDFFFEESGRGFLVNEINTIPGFTPISQYPRLLEASGVSYAELLDRLIELGLAREERRAARRGRSR